MQSIYVLEGMSSLSYTRIKYLAVGSGLLLWGCTGHAVGVEELQDESLPISPAIAPQPVEGVEEVRLEHLKLEVYGESVDLHPAAQQGEYTAEVPMWVSELEVRGKGSAGSELSVNDQLAPSGSASIGLQRGLNRIKVEVNRGEKEQTVYVDVTRREKVELVSTLQGPEEAEDFGTSIALSGEYLFVGAPSEDDDKGAVHLYKRQGENWKEVDQGPLKGVEESSEFGSSIAVLGERLFVGAPYENSLKGAVHLYEKQGDSWNKVGEPIKGLEESFGFGMDVAVLGERLFVGAPGENEGQGAVHLYTLEKGNWNSLRVIDGLEKSRFGFSIAVFGERLFVGAPGEDSWTGAVHFFERDGNAWKEMGKPITGIKEKSQFGARVAAFGENLLVGAPGENKDQGVVRLYAREHGEWNSIESIKGSDEDSVFGQGMAVDAHQLIVGDPKKKAVYIYH